MALAVSFFCAHHVAVQSLYKPEDTCWTRGEQAHQTVIKSLVNEDIKSLLPFQIHRRLSMATTHLAATKHLSDANSSDTVICQCGHNPSGSEPSVRVSDSIQLVERLILKDQWITCLELVPKVNISVQMSNTIIHEDLQFWKVSTHRVPRNKGQAQGQGWRCPC